MLRANIHHRLGLVYASNVKKENLLQSVHLAVPPVAPELTPRPNHRRRALRASLVNIHLLTAVLLMVEVLQLVLFALAQLDLHSVAAIVLGCLVLVKNLIMPVTIRAPLAAPVNTHQTKRLPAAYAARENIHQLIQLHARSAQQEDIQLKNR